MNPDATDTPDTSPATTPIPLARRTLAGEPVADPAEALAHFERLLRLETDCWDVHEALRKGESGIVVLDVRAPDAYAAGHVAGARSLPHGAITPRALASDPPDVLYVVYCDGPHCNGADRAARTLARLGRRVKKMLGGITGWKDEGFTLAGGD